MLPGFFWDTFINTYGKIKEKDELALIAGALPPDTKTPAVRGGPGPLPGCGETEGEPPAFFPRNRCPYKRVRHDTKKSMNSPSSRAHYYRIQKHLRCAAGRARSQAAGKLRGNLPLSSRVTDPL